MAIVFSVATKSQWIYRAFQEPSSSNEPPSCGIIRSAEITRMNPEKRAGTKILLLFPWVLSFTAR